MLNDILLNAGFMLLGLVTTFLIERPKLRKSEAENQDLRQRLTLLQQGISQTQQDLLGRQGIPTSRDAITTQTKARGSDIAGEVLTHARNKQDGHGQLKVVDLKSALLEDGHELHLVEHTFEALELDGKLRRVGNKFQVTL